MVITYLVLLPMLLVICKDTEFECVADNATKFCVKQSEAGLSIPLHNGLCLLLFVIVVIVIVILVIACYCYCCYCCYCYCYCHCRLQPAQ